jgi:hypothetical protein
MIKVNLKDLLEDQEMADTELYDAENNQGLWDSTSYEFNEQDRLDKISECQDRLKPVELDRVHLPQLPLVRAKENDLPFNTNETYVCLGEIAQMPGHVVVFDHKTGQIYSGYHSDRFEIIPASEA